MLPTFNVTGDMVLTKHASFTGENVQGRSPSLSIGDFVISVHPYTPDRLVCKQILGMPGDTICVDPTADGGKEMVTIPRGHVWLAGLNPSHSIDSRVYGPVPIALLRGKIIAKVSHHLPLQMPNDD